MKRALRFLSRLPCNFRESRAHWLASSLLSRQRMRTVLFLLSILFGVMSCKSEECGGCALRYCDEPAGPCDCGCFDGQVVAGATCKNGCFERPTRQELDCGQVGCAAPPLCSTGCTDRCGCCACVDGTVEGGLKCMGGCYVPLDMM